MRACVRVCVRGTCGVSTCVMLLKHSLLSPITVDAAARTKVSSSEGQARGLPLEPHFNGQLSVGVLVGHRIGHHSNMGIGSTANWQINKKKKTPIA